MKRLTLLILALLSFGILFGESITKEDTRLTILYVCGIEGRYAFDKEGRKGLATITELKRRELERNFSEKGGVLLLSRGNFFHKDTDNSSWTLIKSALFDGIFLGDGEVSYLEANPNLTKLGLPILSQRDNLAGVETEKIYDIEDVSVKVTPYLINKPPYHSSKKIHLNLVFPETDSEQDLGEIIPEIPVIFFLPKDKSTAFSFRRNVYTAECPDSMDKLGKLTLTYRKQKLIRQHQEFIPLNTKDLNQSWIYPFQP
jgi:hypothetical protein